MLPNVNNGTLREYGFPKITLHCWGIALHSGSTAIAEHIMEHPNNYPLTMIDLLRAVYWYDEALQTIMRRGGWPTITRTQSLLFASIATGEKRPARLAEKMGVTRQSLSELISGLVKRNILVTKPDPTDRRAVHVEFHPDSRGLRRAATQAMRDIHEVLGQRIGIEQLAALDVALQGDWGNPDILGEN